MYRYDIAPGQLVETDEPLSQDDIDQAREQHADGKSLQQIAKKLHGRVYEPDEQPVSRVAVDQVELENLLEHAYPDESERDRVRQEVMKRG
jgi:hypothetical protein